MSTGRFTNSVYQDDNSTLRPIRVQPETLAATIGGTANAAPAGTPATGVPRVKLSAGRREFGVYARRVSCTWDEGGAPDGYDERTPFSIIVLNPSVFNAAPLGGAVSYLGGSATIVGKSSESIR